jgi:hypothetical protein
MINAHALIAVGLTAILLATAASAQATLNSVKQKGVLTCGSNRRARLRRAGCTGQLVRSRSRPLPRHRGRHLRRPGQGTGGQNALWIKGSLQYGIPVR